MYRMNVPDYFHQMNRESQEQRPNPYSNYMMRPPGLPNYQYYRPQAFARLNQMYSQQDFQDDNIAFARFLRQYGFPMNYSIPDEEYFIHVNNYLNPHNTYMFDMPRLMRVNGMYLPREQFNFEAYYRRNAQYMPQRCWNHCAYEEEYEAYNNAYPQFIPQMHIPPMFRMNQMYVPQQEFNNEGSFERNAQNIPQDNAQSNEDMINLSSSEDELEANDSSTQILTQDDVAMDMNELSSSDDDGETSNQAIDYNTQNIPRHSENNMQPLIRIHDVEALNKRYSIDTNGTVPQSTFQRIIPPLVRRNEECLCQRLASSANNYAAAQNITQNVPIPTIESPTPEQVSTQNYEIRPWPMRTMNMPNTEQRVELPQNIANMQPRDYRGMDFDEDAEDDDSEESNNDETDDEAPQVKRKPFNPNIIFINRMRQNAYHNTYMSVAPSTSQNNDVIVIEDNEN